MFFIFQLSASGSSSSKPTPKLLIRKSRKGGNYRFNSGVLRPTIFPDSGRLYLFEAVLTHASPVVPGTRRGSMLSLQGNTSNDSNTIWKHMGFWEDLFFGKLGY